MPGPLIPISALLARRILIKGLISGVGWAVGRNAVDAIVGNKARNDGNGGNSSGNNTPQDWGRGNQYNVSNYTTIVNTNVIAPTFTRTFNYRTPEPIFKKVYVPLSIPEPKLPTEVDTQTATKTPVGSSINIGKDFQSYGLLKYNPDSDNVTCTLRSAPTSAWDTAFNASQSKNLDLLMQRRAHEINPQEYPKVKSDINQNGFLVYAENLNGFNGQVGLIAGLDTISVMAQMYRDTSSLAYFLPSNNIPVKFDISTQSNPLKPLEDVGNITLDAKDLQTCLGFNMLDQDWEDLGIEDLIKYFGQEQYDTGNQTVPGFPQNEPAKPNKIKRVNNFAEYVTHLVASLFFRSGFHRFPAELPESLKLDPDKYKNPKDQPHIFIDDALEYQEYLLRNLDDIFGQFPIKFIYKTKDENNKEIETEIKIPNIAEALTEMVGTSVDTYNNTDVLINLSLKTLTETIKAVNGSLIASDIAKANQDYLGYNYEEFEREREVPLNPQGENFKQLLKNSTQKLVSIKYKDKSDITTQLNLISTCVQICKLALTQRKNFITGDAIRDTVKKKTTGAKDKYKKEWEELVKAYTDVNNKSPKFPKAKVKDKSIPDPTQNNNQNNT